MSAVTAITYEIVGDGLAIVEAHDDAILAQAKTCWALVEKYGGAGFRPCRHTGLRSIFFGADIAPKGFRKIGRDGDKIECVPRRSTKVGKEIERDFRTIERQPSGNDLAAHFGWKTDSFVIDGTSIYFPTYLSIKFPENRHFLRLPRQSDDGWTPPPALRELLESELMAALEAHNAESKRQKDAKATPAKGEGV